MSLAQSFRIKAFAVNYRFVKIVEVWKAERLLTCHPSKLHIELAVGSLRRANHNKQTPDNGRPQVQN
jgi:hypothetical protein